MNKNKESGKFKTLNRSELKAIVGGTERKCLNNAQCAEWNGGGRWWCIEGKCYYQGT